ncbi:MAG TPA: type I-E CRISPR-associated protein Cse1/CasA [Spirochaetia bacterium]|nr:type I-E CRISPR-associated protein Cse1/CasA [Spirochaetia bacterium]
MKKKVKSVSKIISSSNTEIDIHAENRFNLVDESWIPVTGKGLVSLKEIFTNGKLKSLGGNPVQKIALLKLLLAISQSACTPKDNEEWEKLGAQGLAEKSLEYLHKNRKCFWLYGEKPFLQMPDVKKAAVQPFGALLPEISTGNTTVLTNSQIDRDLSDAERALLVVQLMGFGLGGKKTDNSIVLTKGYCKGSTGKPGPSISFMGHLHNFLIGKNLIETLWLNTFSKFEIKNLKYFENAIGKAPWEQMPNGENDEISKILKSSFIGRLIPVARFLLLTQNGAHYTEGILHNGYKDGIFDTSMAVEISGKKSKTIWVDPSLRPWRQLSSMLSFLESGSSSHFSCPNIQKNNVLPLKIKRIGIWSGGLRVKSNAGEQYVSGINDYVESTMFFNRKWLDKNWFLTFKSEMAELDNIVKKIFGSVTGYYKLLNADGKKSAAKATGLFWALCERNAQELIDACPQEKAEERVKLRKVFLRYVYQVYDTICPHDTARQIEAWAKNRPRIGDYLKK